MLGRSALTGFVLVAALGLGPGAGTAQACLDTDLRRGARVIHQPGDKFEFLVRTDRSAARARSLRRLVSEVWAELRPVFGDTLPGFEGPRSPFEIILARATGGATGLYDHWCERPDRVGVVVDRDLNPGFFRETMVHELFHAFQGGAVGREFDDGWWDEATATWYSAETVGLDDPADLDRSFLQVPRLPLDDFSGDRTHAYGAL